MMMMSYRGRGEKNRLKTRNIRRDKNMKRKRKEEGTGEKSRDKKTRPN